MKRPLRESIAGKKEPPFTSEREAREAVALLRSRHASVAEAEASAEWPALHRRLTNWVWRVARALPIVGAEESARAIANVYLRQPKFLTALPPANFDEGDAND
jgi:hypothetical protein